MNRNQRRAADRAQAKANTKIMMLSAMGRSVSAALHPLLWKSAPTSQAYVCQNPRIDTQSEHSSNAAAAVLPEAKAPEKACRQCKETKPLREFGTHAQSKDGHRPTCTACYSLRKRETAPRKPTPAATHKRCSVCLQNRPFAKFESYFIENTLAFRPACRDCDDKQKKAAARQARETTTLKYCKRCNQHKPLMAFQRFKGNGDNYHARCIPCEAAREIELEQKARAKKAPADWKPYDFDKPAIGMKPSEVARNKRDNAKDRKHCETCGHERELHHYDPDPYGLFGVVDTCRLCKTAKAIADGKIAPPCPASFIQHAPIIQRAPEAPRHASGFPINPFGARRAADSAAGFAEPVRAPDTQENTDDEQENELDAL